MTAGTRVQQSSSSAGDRTVEVTCVVRATTRPYAGSVVFFRWRGSEVEEVRVHGWQRRWRYGTACEGGQNPARHVGPEERTDAWTRR